MVNEFFSALILAVIQGITEWFPVSSSGHLVLFERILNYSGGLMFEVALHFGTLMAVFVYVLPNDLDNYDSKKLSLEIGKEVCVFAVNDKEKYDPEGKSKNVKPGRPGIHIE